MKTVQFDWVGFTFDLDYDFKFVTTEFLPNYALEKMDRGGLGYHSFYMDLDSCIFLYADGNENMGVHLDFSSSGVSCFFTCAADLYYRLHPEIQDRTLWDSTNSYNLYFLLQFMLSYGHFTRLDIAMDEEEAEEISFTPGELEVYWKNDQIVTRCSTHKFISTEGGDSFYIGSRSSCLMLRVYDKGRQMKTCYPWVRWEFEIKSSEYCDLFIHRLGECLNLPLLFIRYLNSFMKIVVPGDSPRRQRSTLERWIISIIGSDEENGRIGIRPMVKKIPLEERVYRFQQWFTRCVAPMCRRLGLYYGKDYAWLYRELNFKKCTYDDYAKYFTGVVFDDDDGTSEEDFVFNC